MAEYDPDAVEDERAIELATIAAIYPELAVDPDSPYCATLQIPISPDVPLGIQFQKLAEHSLPSHPTPPVSGEDEVEDEELKGAAHEVLRLEHFPPISLKISLPQGYPLAKPPIFELSCTPPWIPDHALRELIDDGTRLWKEHGRDQVVFTYIDHLQQCADAGLSQVVNLEHDLILPSDLKIALFDFNLKATREAFAKETFDCGICLEPKKGAKCHRLGLCSHVFCVECLQECFGKCISEGDVDNVRCLDPGCGKARKTTQAEQTADLAQPRARRRRKHDATLHPSELLQIPLTEEQVRRYVRLKRTKKLESDKNTVYCPRSWCQGAARSKKYPKPADPLHGFEELPSDSDSELQDAGQTSSNSKQKELLAMPDRLCICEDCNYAFCVVCSRGWHGELISYRQCNPRQQHELTEEEKASADYVARYSTACPTCSSPCQKTMGCNHMICFKCRDHFCYLCSSYLMEDNPYEHYNKQGEPCYHRLWVLEAGDDPEVRAEALEAADLNAVADPIFADSDSDSDDDFDESSDEDEGPPPRQVRARVGAPRGGVQPVRGRGGGGGGVRGGRGAHEQGPPRQARGRRRGRGRGAGRGRGGHGNGAANAGQPAPNPPPAAQQPAQAVLRDRNADVDSDRDSTEDEVPIRFVHREAEQRHEPGNNNIDDNNDNNGNNEQPQGGIDRFLQLAERDQEDEWDSDELEDEFGDMEIEERRRARPRVMGWRR